MQGIILLFTKYPQPGISKTRLIPAVGAEKAAEIQHHMTKKVLGNISHITEELPCKFAIYHDGGTSKLMAEWLGEKYRFTQQIQDDLGKRMESAIADHLRRYEAIIIIGSDCPDIDDSILHQAFIVLKSHQVVIGPAYDGGYYLIGVQGDIDLNILSHLFSDIQWGSEEVLSQTIARVEQKNISYQLLKKLHDIDTPADLRYFNYNPNA